MTCKTLLTVFFPVLRFITGALSRFSPSIEIHVSQKPRCDEIRLFSLPLQVATLARSMRIAGEVGSEGLPAVTGAKKMGKEKDTFTVIDNKGAIALAKTET